MFPTNVCFEKYNLKDRLPSLFKRYDEANLPHLYACSGTKHACHLIRSQYILRKLEERVYKDTLKKFDR